MRNTRTFVIILVTLTVLASLLVRSGLFGGSARASALLRAATPTEVLAEVRGGGPARKLTVLNLWASWCEPCKREFPYFLRARREFADAGVEVLFVSVDDGADFDEAEDFLKRNGVDFPTFYKGKQSLNFAAELIPNWTGAVPATVLFGSDGRVLESWEGDTTYENLSAKVRAHLGNPS